MNSIHQKLEGYRSDGLPVSQRRVGLEDLIFFGSGIFATVVSGFTFDTETPIRDTGLVIAGLITTYLGGRNILRK